MIWCFFAQVVCSASVQFLAASWQLRCEITPPKHRGDLRYAAAHAHDEMRPRFEGIDAAPECAGHGFGISPPSAAASCPDLEQGAALERVARRVPKTAVCRRPYGGGGATCSMTAVTKAGPDSSPRSRRRAWAAPGRSLPGAADEIARVLADHEGPMRVLVPHQHERRFVQDDSAVEGPDDSVGSSEIDAKSTHVGLPKGIERDGLDATHTTQLHGRFRGAALGAIVRRERPRPREVTPAGAASKL